MSTRKQRRREQKLRRHEWEEVYVDAEGNEVPAEEVEDAPAVGRETAKERNGRPPAKASAPARGGRGAGREVKPPSWNRVLKRAAIFAPIMFIVVSLLSKDLTITQKVTQTALLLVFFVPFSYLMDVVMYRTYLKRTGQMPPRKR